ncbi:acylphosphatase-2 isoform X1 [Cydia pomonella]|uniref:acylphosphatase-2 isoform X1 n=1 Tax=Cydia pomonella TaxID=82600 RepID=UPI002ADE2D80|nr:acylphosphatase-2 isoform X1 [Cydia pomonella]
MTVAVMRTLIILAINRFRYTCPRCYFTKYCKEVAETIGIVGWVKNSKQGTIVGKIQGVKPLMDQMIEWLSTVGSPGCKIQKCDLTNSQQLARLDYHDFTIRF